MHTTKMVRICCLLFMATILLLISCNINRTKDNKDDSALAKGDLAVCLNESLAQGWNTWNTRNVLSHVLLPESFAIELYLQDNSMKNVLKEVLIGLSNDNEIITPGPHTYDGSYTELDVEWGNIKINVKTAASENDLAILITPVPSEKPGNIIVNPRVIWDKPGTVDLFEDGFAISNVGTKVRFYLIASSAVSLTDSTIVCPLHDKIIISTYSEKSPEDIVAKITFAENELSETKKAYGENKDLYDAMQTVLAWDVIYEPTLQMVISPVSRVWNAGWWGGWVLFDWDTYFAAYMYAIDNKELAYANAIAITKQITQRGFIPNFASGLGKSEDRSQPPVGSFVVWKIFEMHQEKWFLEEVFAELLSWNRWWTNNRDLNGYLCWGSNPYESDMPEWLTSEINRKQAAMWESGLDNSPMWDDAQYDSDKHLMLLADVGLMSMYIWDCRYLAKIALELGKPELTKELEDRANKYSQQLQTLYDEETGLYLNKDLVTGEFSHRLSPTHFYPLLAGVPSQKQAERMMQEHFYNPDEFWGEWILPSIARNDPAFKDNTYWRGRIWAPMNFLVYKGIINYDLPDARRDLVEKSKNLILKSWLEERHVYENYNATTGEGGDVENSDKFYHWGALLSFIKLLEDQKGE